MKSVWFAEILLRLSNASSGGTTLPALPAKEQIAVTSVSTTWILGVGILIVALMSLAIFIHRRKK